MARRYSNTATRSSLTAAATAGADTLLVASTAGWPVPPAGDVAVAAVDAATPATLEVVTYTGLTANSLTGVTRGQDGTAARAHNAGVAVHHVVSAVDVEEARRLVDARYQLAPHPASLRRWRAALAGRATDPATMLWLGDSILALGLTPPATDDARIMRRVAAGLRHRLLIPGAGRGYYPARVGAGSPWAATAGVLASASYGLGRISAQLGAAGHSMTITVPGCDRFHLMFTGWAGVTGTAGISIDGGGVVNVDTAALGAGGFRAGRRWDSGPLAAGDHTVVVSWVAGGAVRLEGLMAYSGDFAAGLHVYEAANSGGQAASLADPAMSLWAGSMDLLQPDLLVLEFGINEKQAGVAPATFAANLVAIYDRVVAGAATAYPGGAPYAPSVLLLSMWAPSAGASPTDAAWAPYRAAMAALALERGWALVDVYELTGFIGADPYGVTTDLLHPSARGNQLIADAVVRAIA